MKRTTVKKEEKAISEAHLKKGDIITLAATSLDEDGCATATYQGKRVHAHGVLPGETARIKVVNVGRYDCHTKLLKLVQASPERVLSPPCAVTRACDSCPLIVMKYPAQLRLKQELIKREMGRYPALADVIMHAPLASPSPLNYRNSAKLAVAGTFTSPVIGIYARHSHDVVDIGDCALHHPLINKIVRAVRQGITKGKVPVYHPKTGNGLLRYLVVRVSEATNSAMVVFVTAWRSYNEIHHLTKFVTERVPEITVVAQNVNASTGNVILGKDDVFLTKQKTITEEIGSITFAISPRSFFQVNTSGANLLYGKVREWAELTGKETVVDLYCGVGGISLFLADRAKQVHGIELVETAVQDADFNARLNRVGNCEFEAGDAGELLKELREEVERVDVMVLNPPRKGCEETVLRNAAALRPGKIIYVSCSPQSLARDLDILAKLGYRTREIQPVDMFPNTAHIENVALIVKEMQE